MKIFERTVDIIERKAILNSIQKNTFACVVFLFTGALYVSAQKINFGPVVAVPITQPFGLEAGQADGPRFDFAMGAFVSFIYKGGFMYQWRALYRNKTIAFKAPFTNGKSADVVFVSQNVKTLEIPFLIGAHI